MPAAAPVQTRNGAIDLLRYLSALGIVWFHVRAPGFTFAYSGLTVFLQLAIALALLTDHGTPILAYVRARAGRLLRPWLIWCAIYSVAKIAQLLVKHESFGQEFQPAMVLTGTALHLWFLPFIAVTGTAAVMLARALPARALPALALLAALLAAAVQAVLYRIACGVPLEQWANASGPVLAGLAIGLAGHQRTGLIRVCAVILCGAVLAWAGQVATGATPIGALWLGLPLALGTLLTTAALVLPRPATGLGQTLAALSMPVYLMHPMILALLGHCGPLGRVSLAVLACGIASAVGLAIYRRKLWALLF